MNDSRQTGLLRLKHLRDVTEAVELEMEAQRPRFVRLAREDSKPRAVTAFNLFQTPPDLAAEMVSGLSGKRWGEFSAGLGRIYRAMREMTGAEIVLVEQSAACCGELYRETEHDERAELIQADFLTCDVERLGGLFDVIVINPPFRLGADRRHIEHALSFLAPGGVLRSLCFNGVRQNKHLRPIADDWRVLPENTFKSEGTRASVAMLEIRK